MKLKDVLQRAVYWYTAEPTLSINLTGPIGMGKTTTMCSLPQVIGKALGKKMGITILNGTTVIDVDLMGFGLPKHYDTHSEMIYSKPWYWRTAPCPGDEGGKMLDEYDGGFVFIDEYDKLPPDAKKMATEGKLSGRIGGHQFPKGWKLWTASNREEDNSGATKNFQHDRDRTLDINLQHDPAGWQEWAIDNGVLPVFCSFADSYKEIVFTSEPPKKITAMCTPRSLVKVNGLAKQIMAHNGGHVPDDALFAEEAAGQIGGPAAQQMIAHIRLSIELPKTREIEAAPDKVPVPEAPDAKMLLCYHLAHEVTPENAEPIVKYLQRFPKEFAVTFAKSSCQRNGQLIKVPAFIQWVSKNASLLASLSALGKKAA